VVAQGEVKRMRWSTEFGPGRYICLPHYRQISPGTYKSYIMAGPLPGNIYVMSGHFYSVFNLFSVAVAIARYSWPTIEPVKDVLWLLETPARMPSPLSARCFTSPLNVLLKSELNPLQVAWQLAT